MKGWGENEGIKLVNKVRERANEGMKKQKNG
jgi:hypothetical protein